MKRNCHKECENNPYCWIEAHAKFHLENQHKIDKCGNPMTGWKDGCHVTVLTTLFYSGRAIHLYPDGTYCLEDTTGG